VTENAKTAREDLLANITYAKDTDGVSSPEYLSALKQLTPQQINDLKTDPTTRTELEAAGIQLDVNFAEMGLDAGDSGFCILGHYIGLYLSSRLLILFPCLFCSSFVHLRVGHVREQ